MTNMYEVKNEDIRKESFDVAQNHLSRGALVKRYSENMQKIYRRTPMQKCDFNKVAKQLY